LLIAFDGRARGRCGKQEREEDGSIYTSEKVFNNTQSYSVLNLFISQFTVLFIFVLEIH